MTFNEERLKEIAEGVRKQSEKYGFPTVPKRKRKETNKKMNDKTEEKETKDLELDGLTENEKRIMLELKNFNVGFATPECLIECVYPSTLEEVRKTIYRLQTKGAPIRDVGLKNGGWRLELPRIIIRHHMDLIERSQKKIYKIMEFSNKKFYKMMGELEQ